MPVGNFKGVQKPGITGFQLWIVLRSILENCKNVDEAIKWAMDTPIGYNIMELFENKKHILKKEIKELLSTFYPEGLCCHYYKDFFGTLRSMIFDVTGKTIETVLGSPQVNKWHTFSVKPLKIQEFQVLLPQDKATKDFYKTL